MTFTTEAEFEEALIYALSQKGWESEVIKYPTEEDLLKNWANILFQNNNTIDRLNDCPLTDSEMQQILEQITALRTPLKLNGFINGKTISVKRDNPQDIAHLGKEVTLKIYDRMEIAAGQSRYQIVQQPKFKASKHVLPNRRGDLMLLINGMPVIHIELKKSGIPVSQATNQIEKYAHEGIFSGIFSLVQVFVAMNPDETVYYANPGPDGRFMSNYYFHWADFNNEPINEWDRIASSLLSIPMAHQLIGFYTVADDADGVLKVMRSYQYYAASKISDTVSKLQWDGKHQLGGYVWHTTGSGKTMTSFKSAQLIANSNDADKVVFLMDRIELGTQSLKEYRAFADATDSIQDTEDTNVLISKLKSDDSRDTLIVTSIQKMSNIRDDSEGMNAADLAKMQSKRIVFIVDECHRSTFGDMLITIKQTFPDAVFFGFTGTPIHDENQKYMNTTTTVFGDELHRYSIADGIRDGNVLGFDPYMVTTYKDKDLRRAVALEKAKAIDEAEALSDDKKREVYNKYMNDVPMAGYKDENNEYHKGIEDYISNSQYAEGEQGKKHRKAVVDDISSNWITLSQNSKFHAIFATSSIPEAVKYYRLFKEVCPEIRVAALFEPTIDNNGGHALEKEDGIVEMLEDYNERYGQDFSMPTYAKYKKDVAARLAHKSPYERMTPDKQLDILIVVDQMLTGFDSKWVNTLYLDKLLKYENLIQAFSRTNRLFGPDKPFGTVRYYRKAHTMERNVEEAFNLYSGDKPYGLFAEKLEFNVDKMADIFKDISILFNNAKIDDFTSLPKDKAERGQFAKLFKQLNQYLEAAKIQGFKWDEDYGDPDSDFVKYIPDEETYLVLAMRYKELFDNKEPDTDKNDDVPYEIDTYLTEIDTGRIDKEYMNSRFTKYLKLLQQDDVDEEELQRTLNELHKSFASLSQDEQKYANIFLHEVQSGDAVLNPDMTFRDYINEYMANAKNDEIHRCAELLGVDEGKLRAIMSCCVTESTLNEYGRFDDLVATVDKSKAKIYFEKLEGKPIPPPKVNPKASTLLREFVLSGGFEIDI